MANNNKPGNEEVLEEVNIEDLNGLEKSAILMISIGSEASSHMYKNLAEDEIEVITKAIVSLKNLFFSRNTLK